MMITKAVVLTYLYISMYILLSCGVILYNKWVLSTKHFNFPFPISLTMFHMAFSGVVSFLLVRVFKVVPPVKMTLETYVTCVVPIGSFFASSLWFGNTAYLYISVAFIQMLKALMPVATFFMAILCGTEKARCDLFLNLLLVSMGVAIASFGEIHFNVIGTAYQVIGILAEALRLVLTQILLQKKGLALNPITTLYYVAPCSFLFLFVPWSMLEMPLIGAQQIVKFKLWIFLSNAFCALSLNVLLFVIISRTSAITVRVASVLKDWILISLSCMLFPESKLTGLNMIGYAIALSGVFTYNYLKMIDARGRSFLSTDLIPEKLKTLLKERKLGRKHSHRYDSFIPDDNLPSMDEELALIPKTDGNS